METSKSEKPVGNRPADPGEGPKYYVDIEGDLYAWNDDEITVPEIIELGDLPEEKGVVIIDLRTQKQRTLDEDEVIELEPGKGFSQKYEFKRGGISYG